MRYDTITYSHNAEPHNKAARDGYEMATLIRRLLVQQRDIGKAFDQADFQLAFSAAAELVTILADHIDPETLPAIRPHEPDLPDIARAIFQAQKQRREK